MGLRFARTTSREDKCAKSREGGRSNRKKTKACALAQLKERAKHTNSRIAIMDACCTNTISARGGTMPPPPRPRDPFQKDSEYNEHPQRRNPHRVHTLLGSCPPPVTGVNLHVYPLIRAGICFFPLHPILLLLSQGSPSFFLSLFFCSVVGFRVVGYRDN